MRALVLVVLASAVAAAQPSGSMRVGISAQVQGLRTSTRPGAPTADLTRQVNSVANGYRQLGSSREPYSHTDAAADGRLAQETSAALYAIERQGVQDPALGRALAGAYGAMGDYQARPGYGSYGLNPVGAYGGASRITRRMILAGGTGQGFERDLERYAMSMATWNVANNRIWGGMPDRDMPQDAYPMGPMPPDRQLPQPPQFDLSTLTAEQKEAWDDLRPQFVAVCARVTASLRALDQLTARLQAGRMDINPANLAASYRMQGFLDDAFALVDQKDFAGGKLALEKADYERSRLKPVTGI